MKLKTLLLLTLFLLLATQASFAQQKNQSKQTSENEYGIDLAKSYTGSEVLELIQIVEQEAQAAIEKAFDEGYKQGLLSSAPDAEYWRVKAAGYEAEVSRLKKERWLYAFGGLGVGFIFGGGFGFTIRLQN
ncbi:MAG: hypothetical protein IJP90_12280 [Treponema sp.]|nr:hypothetical protein [Treponema sp.]